MTTTTSDPMAKVAEIVGDFRVAMLTTHAPDGHLRSRPMRTTERVFDGRLYFFTTVDSDLLTDTRHQPTIGVAYAHPADGRYAFLTGATRVEQDRELMKKLWTAEHAKYLPAGPDDPSVALLEVDVQRGEYWDETTGLLAAAGNVLTRVTGGAPKVRVDHGEVKP